MIRLELRGEQHVLEQFCRELQPIVYMVKHKRIICGVTHISNITAPRGVHIAVISHS